MPPGVAAAPAPSMRTGGGSIADGPTARPRTATTACASHSVTDVNAYSQSPGCGSAAAALVKARRSPVDALCIISMWSRR